MPKSIEIIIPEFVQEIKLSNSAAEKYYKWGEPVPDKFFQSSTSTKLKPEFGWSAKKLYHKKTGKYIVKNSATAGKPRYKTIAGNDIWAKVHERVRMNIVDTIKKDFRPHLPQELDLKFPISMEAEIHTTPKFCNWDVGNLWVYDKVFEDLLQDVGLIPNDNVLYICKSPGLKFIPIINENQRMLKFTLTEETDPRIINHVMYDLKRIKDYNFYAGFEPMMAYLKNPSMPWHGTRNYIQLMLTNQGEPGSVYFDAPILWISSGKKKILYGAIRRGIESCFSIAVQQNADIIIPNSFLIKLEGFIETELRQRGLRVHIYHDEDRAEVQMHSQDATV